MKLSFVSLFFLLHCFLAFSQSAYVKSRNEQLNSEYISKEVLNNNFLKRDFSGLFTQTSNSSIFGFIGDNYERIRIKFLSVKKDSLSADIYDIYGKSMVGGNICEFTGTIKITYIKAYKFISMGVDSEYKDKGITGEFAMFGVYSFFENVNKKNSGVFEGVWRTDFYLDKYSQIHYDDLNMVSDGFTNNQFVGKWTSYKTKISKKCNWGDFRIPNSGDFDVGAGDFSPSKNLESGWQTVVDLNNPKKRADAKKVEDAEWWK